MRTTVSASEQLMELYEHPNVMAIIEAASAISPRNPRQVGTFVTNQVKELVPKYLISLPDPLAAIGREGSGTGSCAVRGALIHAVTSQIPHMYAGLVSTKMHLWNVIGNADSMRAAVIDNGKVGIVSGTERGTFTVHGIPRINPDEPNRHHANYYMASLLHEHAGEESWRERVVFVRDAATNLVMDAEGYTGRRIEAQVCGGIAANRLIERLCFSE